jgi:hypothetical protein
LDKERAIVPQRITVEDVKLAKQWHAELAYFPAQASIGFALQSLWNGCPLSKFRAYRAKLDRGLVLDVSQGVFREQLQVALRTPKDAKLARGIIHMTEKGILMQAVDVPDFLVKPDALYQEYVNAGLGPKLLKLFRTDRVTRRPKQGYLLRTELKDLQKRYAVYEKQRAGFYQEYTALDVEQGWPEKWALYTLEQHRAHARILRDCRDKKRSKRSRPEIIAGGFAFLFSEYVFPDALTTWHENHTNVRDPVTGSSHAPYCWDPKPLPPAQREEWISLLLDGVAARRPDFYSFLFFISGSPELQSLLQKKLHESDLNKHALIDLLY